MPTEKTNRLNITLNEKDIEDLNKIREFWLTYNKGAKFSYVDIVRGLIKTYQPTIESATKF